ncbi:YhfC family intramembrane metalloprotease [Candidatus Peregrinibacteria bacterium]|nr:YhfC family intramembrane metalloprotease [Candidatus Peregrinibacteria bacterium]
MPSSPLKRIPDLASLRQPFLFLLRIVREDRYEKHTVEVLNRYIELPPELRGQFVIVQIHLRDQWVTIWQERGDWTALVRSRKTFIVHTGNFGKKKKRCFLKFAQNHTSAHTQENGKKGGPHGMLHSPPMHVPSLTLGTITASLLIALLTPMVAIVLLRRSGTIHWRAMAIGAFIWFVATQLLERSLHLAVLQFTALPSSPFFFALYAVLAAGIFEEGGRILAFTTVLRGMRKRTDAIAYGVGHGGMECIFIGVLSSLSLLLSAFLLTRGSFGAMSGRIPATQLLLLVDLLTKAPSILFLIAGTERLFAFLIQIGLSLAMLLAITRERTDLILATILLHALLDLPAALYQTHILPLLWTEVLIGIEGIAALIWIVQSRKFFAGIE